MTEVVFLDSSVLFNILEVPRKDALVKLMGQSCLGSEPMEGVVLRRDDGQRCKVLRPGFVRAGDADIGRSRNLLAPLP